MVGYGYGTDEAVREIVGEENRFWKRKLHEDRLLKRILKGKEGSSEPNKKGYENMKGGEREKR